MLFYHMHINSNKAKFNSLNYVSVLTLLQGRHKDNAAVLERAKGALGK